MLYPLKLNAAFKDYLWGGTRLRDEFNKQTDIDPVEIQTTRGIGIS